MTITVAKLKRALEETAASLSIDDLRGNPMVEIAADPTSLTILAEKLSERPAPLVMDHRTGVVREAVRAMEDRISDVGRRLLLDEDKYRAREDSND